MFFSAVPSSPPQNIHFKMLGNTTAKLIWEPPPKHRRNGPLLGYRVFIALGFCLLLCLICFSGYGSDLVLKSLAYPEGEA